MSRISSYKAFTLIELLVAVAVISILVAVAVPQYFRFIARAKRTDAYAMLTCAHKAQTSYFAGVDHFLRTCSGSSCSTFVPAEVVVINDYLGLDPHAVTRMGYRLTWEHWNDPPMPNAMDYGLLLVADLVPDNGLSDSVYIGVNTEIVVACGAYGAQNGQPFIQIDDITHLRHPCP